MKAVILDLETRIDVAPTRGDDGALAAPRSVTITLRPCWRKPPVRLQLVYQYECQGVAYYAAERS